MELRSKTFLALVSLVASFQVKNVFKRRKEKEKKMVTFPLRGPGDLTFSCRYGWGWVGGWGFN